MFLKFRLLFEHLPAPILIGIIFNSYDPDINYVWVTLIFGWLIDVDHLFDYLLWKVKNKGPFDFKTIFNGSYFRANNKVYVPFHSFEVGLFFFLIYFLEITEIGLLFLAAGISLVVHLVQDMLSYRINIWGYFFLCRAAHSFDFDWFCNDKE